MSFSNQNWNGRTEAEYRSEHLAIGLTAAYFEVYDIPASPLGWLLGDKSDIRAVGTRVHLRADASEIRQLLDAQLAIWK